MARVKIEIVLALRAVAAALAESKHYQWGHMGSCNCGFLAQHITGLGKADIHARAMLGKGDWNEQLNDYCPASGLPMDVLISNLVSFGFDIDDLKHLERLSSPEILSILGGQKRHLRFNEKADVITYLQCWAYLVEARLIESIDVADLVVETTALQLQPE